MVVNYAILYVSEIMKSLIFMFLWGGGSREGLEPSIWYLVSGSVGKAHDYVKLSILCMVKAPEDTSGLLGPDS